MHRACVGHESNVCCITALAMICILPQPICAQLKHQHQSCTLVLQKQEAQFKAAELEFHQKQLQHVSEEQRQAEEQIHVSLEGQDSLARGGELF